jgi:hypothetical protein
MSEIRFKSRVRHWNPDAASGLAVADIPGDEIPKFGGLRQQRVRGTVGGMKFASNVMPAGGGRLAVSMSKAILTAAGIGVGDEVDFVITGIGRD